MMMMIVKEGLIGLNVVVLSFLSDLYLPEGRTALTGHKYIRGWVLGPAFHLSRLYFYGAGMEKRLASIFDELSLR